MYSRRRSNKLPDFLVSKFRKDFDNLMQPNKPQTPVSRSLDALDHYDPSLLDFNPFNDPYQQGGPHQQSQQQDQKVDTSPDFANLEHLPQEWRSSFMAAGNGPFDMPDLPGAFFPGTPTPGPDGTAQKGAQDHQHSVGLETPVSASASTAHFFPSRSHSLSLSDPCFPQGSTSLQHISTFPQAAGGFPPHLFEHQRPTDAMGVELNSSFNAAARQAGFSSSGRVPANLQMPASWNMDPRSGSNDLAVIRDDEDDNRLESFRFRNTLKAATAMVKTLDETPITYLNKSQLYELSVADRSSESTMSYGPVRYRTAIRIAFEDDQMRRRPETAWKLWWEGRGKDEAYKRGGKRQAVEFALPDGGHDPSRNANIRLVNESFDGFSVEWSPASGRPAECSLYMRCHFLSTDFSLSKGVKGCSVRLCSKTEVLNPSPDSPSPSKEICYCNVKTFRDHGAERKLQNDRQHVIKQIDRVQKQIDQADAEEKDGSKRKRRGSYIDGRPAKVPRTRRASGSSHSSDDEQDLGSDGLQKKLRAYQQMPTSTRAESRLYLRAEEQDDLDTHPIILHGRSPNPKGTGVFQPPTLRPEPTANSSSGGNTNPPDSSSGVRKSSRSHGTSLYPTPPHFASHSSTDTQATSGRLSSHGELSTDVLQLASPTSSGSKRVDTISVNAHEIPAIEIKDLDPSYRPPPTPTNKPVCCLYVKPSIAGRRVDDDNYRAVYLRQRTLNEFIIAITSKCGLDPSNVLSTVRVNERGLQIRVEDDMIREMAEQQDLLAEFDPVELTHDSIEDLFKHEEEGHSTPPIRYQLTLRY